MAVVLLLLSGSAMLGLSNVIGLSSPRAGQDSERGRMELQRVQSLASQPRYGECWTRALEHLDTRCKDMTSESQSRVALKFTHCHLSSSGRHFPACPEGSEVSRCTGGMDAVAFNAYTEFFTHTHSICHFLQSEVWQSRAESTMYRLTESSAGVAEQLQSTRQVTENLIEAQSAALQAQQEILNNGEELKVTLKDSTQGLRAVFSELSSVSREQQVALSELFNRVSFLQSFLMMEAHSLSSCCYNAAALCTVFLLTSTQRSSRARLVLLGLVCFNFYLERKIYQFVMSSDHPEHRHMELVTMYVNMLRRLMVCVALCVLLRVCARYRDPVQQSLQVLQQLKETQCRLQDVLQRAESLGQAQTRSEDNPVQIQAKPAENSHRETTSPSVSLLQRRAESRSREEVLRRRHMKLRGEEEEEVCSSDQSHLSHTGADSILLPTTTHNALVSPGRHPRRSSSSPLVYNVLVEDRQRRYILRSRTSDTH